MDRRALLPVFGAPAPCAAPYPAGARPPQLATLFTARSCCCCLVCLRAACAALTPPQLQVGYSIAWMTLSSLLNDYSDLYGPSRRARPARDLAGGAGPALHRWPGADRGVSARSLLLMNIAYFLPSIPLLVVSSFCDEWLDERFGAPRGLRWAHTGACLTRVAAEALLASSVPVPPAYHQLCVCSVVQVCFPTARDVLFRTSTLPHCYSPRLLPSRSEPWTGSSGRACCCRAPGVTRVVLARLVAGLGGCGVVCAVFPWLPETIWCEPSCLLTRCAGLRAPRPGRTVTPSAILTVSPVLREAVGAVFPRVLCFLPQLPACRPPSSSKQHGACPLRPVLVSGARATVWWTRVGVQAPAAQPGRRPSVAPAPQVAARDDHRARLRERGCLQRVVPDGRPLRQQECHLARARLRGQRPGGAGAGAGAGRAARRRAPAQRLAAGADRGRAVWAPGAAALRRASVSRGSVLGFD